MNEILIDWPRTSRREEGELEEEAALVSAVVVAV